MDVKRETNEIHKKLHKKIYKKQIKSIQQHFNDTEPYQTDDCAICLDSIKNSKLVSTLRCGHVFHHNCIKKVDSHCPMCRKSYSFGLRNIKKDINFLIHLKIKN